MTFAEYFAYLSTITSTYVTTNTTIVSNAIAPAVYSLLSLYVVLWGVTSLRGLIQEPITEAGSRIVKIALVCSLALQLGHYNELIVSTFVDGPEELARQLTGATNTNATIAALDITLAAGFAVAKGFWDKAGLFTGDIGMYVTAFIILALTLGVTIYSFVLLILAKMMMCIVIALGPIFIISLLFQSSAGYFNAWVHKLANYALLSILVIGTNMIFLTIFQRAAAGSSAGGSQLDQIVPMTITGIVAIAALAQLTSVAAGLAGGLAMSTQGAGSLGLSMLSGSAGKAGSLLKAGAGKIPKPRPPQPPRKVPRDPSPTPGAYENRDNQIGPA
jgi:type IV secretion system protein VirB6